MLYEFYGKECPHCIRMMELTDKLMKEYSIEVVRKEVWHNKENMALVEELDKGSVCGGLPYYYNEATKKTICGEANYEELKKWARV